LTDEEIAKQMLWWARSSCEDTVKRISQFKMDKEMMLSVASDLDIIAACLRKNAIGMKN
jgi:hypothetical protein